MQDLMERLKELSRRTERCEDLCQVAAYFHDEVATRECLERSVPVLAPQIEAAVEAAMQHVLGPKVVFAGIRMAMIEAASFVHGAGYCEDHIVAFFVFATMGKGVAVVSRMDQTGPTHFVRLTMTVLPDGHLVRNPGGVH